MKISSLQSGGILTLDPQVSALWEKLRHFSFDDHGGPKTFSVRLASAQGWSPGFTARAIEEYRRFLLLFALNERKLTNGQLPADGRPAVQIVPSEMVDKVWHLHLLYTHSYWENLCRDILETPLHHVPADGSRGEAASLNTVYQGTLEAYEQTFGEPPPADVWTRSSTQPNQSPLPLAETPSFAKANPSTASSGSSLAKLASTVLAVCFFLAFLFVNEGFSAWLAVGSVTVVGGLVMVVAAVQSGGGNARRSAYRASALGESGGYLGWSCSGSSSSDGVAHSHHSGGHDGGGHSHSDGGHSCGGHSCGGHGCGGGGCGGGH